MKKKRTRSIPQLFYLSKEESEFLAKKMEAAGTRNKSGYLREMALNGYILRQDFTVLNGMAHELSRIGNNLNQMARMANTYGDVNSSELKKIKEDFDRIWQQLLSLV